jgi:hypothetical protein
VRRSNTIEMMVAVLALLLAAVPFAPPLRAATSSSYEFLPGPNYTQGDTKVTLHTFGFSGPPYPIRVDWVNPNGSTAPYCNTGGCGASYDQQVADNGALVWRDFYFYIADQQRVSGTYTAIAYSYQSGSYAEMFRASFTLSGATPPPALRCYVNAGASGANDGTSWADAYTDLQSALGTSACTEAWVKSGVYRPTTGTNRRATFQLKSGVALYGGFAGTETASAQRDPMLNITILSGDIDNNDSQSPIITDTTTATGSETNSYHVVTGASGAILDGFTITAGNANASGSGNQYEGSGGGMYNRLSSPTVTNVTFVGNQAESYGGGMANFGSSPRLSRCSLFGNWAGYGGGMFNYTSNPTLTDVTFSGNSAMDDCGVGSACGTGGGMGNYSSNPTLTNVAFSGNQALNVGGGMGNSASSPTLTNVTFAGNQGVYGGGGGMANWNSSSPTIRNSIFWGSDGQIYDAASAGSPVVSYCVVQGGYVNGTHIIATDPRLGPLGDYGGTVKTIPLQAGSSAIDTAENAVCPATDERGYMRPVDGNGDGSASCDIGAFEYGARAMPVPPGAPSLLAPTNGTITTTPAITFIWQAGAGPAAEGYNVRVNGGGVVTVTGTTSATVLSTGVHSWTVRAYNADGYSDWATPWTVEVRRYGFYLPLVLRVP